jgi:hAT family C-terminal dimerisation region
MGVLRRQLAAHMSRSGLFAKGIWASRKPGVNVSVALVITLAPDGWWREVGSDTPDLCRVATRVLAMVPSSCSIERSFLLQKRIHSKVRNPLAHKTVRQLMFVHCNLELSGPNGPVGDDDLDFLEPWWRLSPATSPARRRGLRRRQRHALGRGLRQRRRRRRRKKRRRQRR